MYLWCSLCTLYLLACHVRVTVGSQGTVTVFVWRLSSASFVVLTKTELLSEWPWSVQSFVAAISATKKRKQSRISPSRCHEKIWDMMTKRIGRPTTCRLKIKNKLVWSQLFLSTRARQCSAITNPAPSQKGCKRTFLLRYNTSSPHNGNVSVPYTHAQSCGSGTRPATQRTWSVWRPKKRPKSCVRSKEVLLIWRQFVTTESNTQTGSDSFYTFLWPQLPSQ